jgi:hypothetical protein
MTACKEGTSPSSHHARAKAAFAGDVICEKVHGYPCAFGLALGRPVDGIAPIRSGSGCTETIEGIFPLGESSDKFARRRSVTHSDAICDAVRSTE